MTLNIQKVNKDHFDDVLLTAKNRLGQSAVKIKIKEGERPANVVNDQGKEQSPSMMCFSV